MAESFETLGAGNGFSSCLEELEISDDEILFNPPSLAETMAAYWNVKSISYGGATLNPGNEPMDLICNPNAGVGAAEAGSSQPNQSGLYTISKVLPEFFFIDGVKYYHHGISMQFSASIDEDPLNGGGRSSAIGVTYLSSLYTASTNLKSYSCVDEKFGPPGEEEVIGKSASETTETIDAVTISGIPFIKKVNKSFGGSFYDPISCPSANYPSIPSDPILELHTY